MGDERPDQKRLGIESFSLRMPGLRAEMSGSTLRRALRLSVLGFAMEWFVRDTPREHDIDQAIEALSNASVLVADLEHDLMRRTEELKTLRSDYEHYKRLSSVDRDEARELLMEVEATVGRGKPKERWVAFLINLAAGAVFFIGGILLQKYVLES